VLQSAYLKVIDGSAQFEGRSSLKTWFFSVIRLTAMERKRSSWLREKILRKNYDSGFFDRPQTALDDSARSLRPQIAKAIKQLSEQQQRLIELVFFHELSLEEAAEIMKIQVGTARTHYQRAKDALSKTLSREDFL
jgi:RNA polymerase sigma factor (sigma-70 family)